SVRITKIMLNLIIKDIKINMLRQWPATFPLQQPVMEALETESSHEFVMTKIHGEHRNLWLLQ
ncbi:TPA: hypothetical protein ACTW7B_005130, partial [Klebsiella pneumoniae]